MNDDLAQFVTLAEAARRLGIHVQSARRLVKGDRAETPTLRSYLVGGRYLVHRDDLEAYAERYDPRPGRKRQLVPLPRAVST